MKRLLYISFAILMTVCAFSCKRVDVDTSLDSVKMKDPQNSAFGKFIYLYAEPTEKANIVDMTEFGFVVGKNNKVTDADATLVREAYYDKGKKEFYATVSYDELGNDFEQTWYARGFIAQNGKKEYSKALLFHLLKPITGISFVETAPIVQVGNSVSLQVKLEPSDVTEASLKWSSDKTNVASVDQTGTVKGVSAGKAKITVQDAENSAVKASIEVTVRNVKPANSIDLGFGPFWADRNLGATSTSDGGLWCAWADRNIYDGNSHVFNWTRYIYRGARNDWHNCIKYYYGDSYRTLADNDDAATNELGAPWRIPSISDFQGLIDNCTVTYPSAGVAVFTSKINGEKLTLPLPGYWSENSSSVYRQLYKGTGGDYWTNEVCFNKNYEYSRTGYANCFRINTETAGDKVSIHAHTRDDGLSVRAVCE